MATNIFCFLLFTWHCVTIILLGLECLSVMFPPRARGRDWTEAKNILTSSWGRGRPSFTIQAKNWIVRRSHDAQEEDNPTRPTHRVHTLAAAAVRLLLQTQHCKLCNHCWPIISNVWNWEWIISAFLEDFRKCSMFGMFRRFHSCSKCSVSIMMIRLCELENGSRLT